MTILRDYQEKALDEIRKHYAAGCKKVLLHLATGGGKTVIFSEILKGVASKGKRAIMVVKGKNLIDQTSQRLTREGVPHGCLQGNHWNYNPTALIQICSVDTLYRRKLAPPADMVVIDECHYATSDSFTWVISQYPDSFFLPVSATPHHKKGFRNIADEVVFPVSILDLMDQGYLSRPVYYAPTKLNLDDIKIDSSTSDYNVAQTAQMLDHASIYGDIISYYKKICNGEPAVLFAVNIEHSISMVSRFKDVGIAAEHVEANTPDKVRAEAIERLRTGEIKVICNVGILTTGVDIPFLNAVILARPTKSYNLMVQMCGRGTRVTDSKNSFYILDHANNISEHGFIENEKVCNLDGKESKPREIKTVTCKECYAVYEYTQFSSICPQCSFDNKMITDIIDKKRKRDEDNEAKLVEIKYVKKSEEELFLDKLISTANLRRYKPGWVFHKFGDRYGKESAQAQWKKIKRSVHTPAQPITESDISRPF